MHEPHPPLARLATERSRPELADLDTRPSLALVELVTSEDAGVVQVVRAAAAQIAGAVDLAVDRLSQGGRLIYVGAGTAGRLAALDAAELGPTYGIGPEQVRSLVAGGDPALHTSAEGAEDDMHAASKDLEVLSPSAKDLVVGISASGRTPYVLAAIEIARAAGAATVAIVNNPESELSALAQLTIEIPTGPEVVAGSTRMKAGTSQKLVLNTLSTATMIRLGKVYRNLMVDVRAANQKLRVRALRVVVEATGVSTDQAQAALEAADGHAKTAIVMLLADLDAPTARQRLHQTAGQVRKAVR
jgi:N-acetylmuramic acid 6-phosphate etherase